MGNKSNESKDIMKNLYIIYGSQTKILDKIYKKKNAFFIRISNKKTPLPLKNAVDVRDFLDFKIKFEECLKNLNPKSIIFVGAAFISQQQLFVSENLDDIKLMLNTNISNYVDYTHFLIPHMIKIRSGNFIFLSSFRSKVTTKGAAVYSASKSFCETFFEVIGKEYGPAGIYANSIRLGCFDGAMFDKLGEEIKKNLRLSIANRRLGNSNDLIKAIDFVLDCNYTNGGVLDLSGGINHN